MTNYFTIAKGSGIELNSARTDFNVNNPIHCAKFKTKEEAQKWIDENNHKFISINSGKPVKLFIIENCPF